MLELLKNIQIQVNEKLYLKDPNSTELGRSIIKNSILLIDEIGMEEFNFKKLAQKINSTESSVYRYFCNKHRLLIYLLSWYWNWLEYKLVFSTANLPEPEIKLKSAISVLIDDIDNYCINEIVNLPLLKRIAISESSKSYLTKEIDIENRNGFFSAYSKLCSRVSNICFEINPEYKYSKALVSTIYEGVHTQKFFSQHLQTLTDFTEQSRIDMKEYFINLALGALKGRVNG